MTLVSLANNIGCDTEFILTEGHLYIQADPVSTGNTFQDLPPLHETADNTESYI
jgi:hypothetical protein